MITEERIEYFKELIKNKEYDSILKEFSLEEREQLNNLILSGNLSLDSVEALFKLNLFTPEEAKSKFENAIFDEKYFMENFLLIFSLDDNEKIKIIEKYKRSDNINFEVISMLVFRLKDDLIKLEYFNDFYDEMDVDSLITLNLSFNNQTIMKENFEKILNSLKTLDDILSFFGKINSFSDFLKKDVMNDILKKVSYNVTSNFEDSFDYLKVIENFKKISGDISYEVIDILLSKFTRDEKINLLKLTIPTYCSGAIKSMISRIIDKDFNGNFADVINLFSYMPDISNKYILINCDKFFITKHINDIVSVVLFEDLKVVLSNHNLLEDIAFLEANMNLILYSLNRDCAIGLDRTKNMYDLFGGHVLKYFFDDQFLSILRLNDNDFNKIIDLFSASKLNKQTINTVYNSLIQIEFGMNNPEVFTLFNEIITDKKEENYKKKTKMMSEYINIDKLLKNPLFLEYINEKNYSLEYCYSNFEEILNILIKEKNELIDLTNEQKLTNLINIICNNFITSKRELYLKERMKDIDNDLNLPKIVVKDKIVSKVVSELSVEELVKLFKMIDVNSLTEEQKNLIGNLDILLECIKFKKNPKGYKENRDIVSKKELLSKYLKIFNKLTEVLFANGLLNKYASEAEKETVIPDKLGEFGIKVLNNIDYINLVNNVLNTDYFEELKTIMKMYGFLGIDDVFGDFIKKIGLEFEFDIDAISSLIEFHPVIFQKIDEIKNKGKIVSLKSYLHLASIYSPTSFYNKILLGKNDFDYFIRNPKPFSGSFSTKQRIESALKYVPVMFKRESITVPSINEVVFNNDGDKSLRVIVGDVTSMINFTYGERTGACMRIGGAADSLFDFSMKNDNGFHIRFEDPKTGQFISRVTCYRNGNTLFLNQLRHSVSPQYRDRDLVEICTRVANMIIDRTKDSNYPINNVIISAGIAMENYVGNLNIVNNSNTQEGYEEFYSDIEKGTQYIMATSAKDKPYEDVVFGPDNAEKYPVLRSRIRTYDNPDEAIARINQLTVINQLMLEKSMGEVEPLTANQVKFAIAGDDWYAYIDNNGQIQSKILDNLPESKKNMAISELKNALAVLKSKISEEVESIEIIEAMGGTYGRK